MKKLFLLLFLFVASQASFAREAVQLTPRQCAAYTLVQYDLKDAVDKGATAETLKQFPFPKDMPSVFSEEMKRITLKWADVDILPLAAAHQFLDACINIEGHFLLPDKL